MILIITPCIVVLACALFTIFRFYQSEKFVKTQEQWLFSFIRNSRRLIEHLPKHRGMANAFLKGDGSFKSPLMSIQSEIDSDLEALKKLLMKKEAVIKDDAIQYMFDDWQTLKQQVLTLSPQVSFSKHTRLIGQFLETLEDTTELTYFKNRIDNFHQRLLNSIVSDIPLLAETIGQARGIGTGVAAQAECSVENRIKLIYLLERSKKIINNSLNPLLNYGKIDSSPLKSEFDTSMNNCNTFLDTLRSTLIDAESIEIEPNQYYQTATHAIESTYTLFDKILPIIENTKTH